MKSVLYNRMLVDFPDIAINQSTIAALCSRVLVEPTESTARPEPVNDWSLLAKLGEVIQIDGDFNAMSICRFQERSVERKPIERLLEVLAEPTLA